MAWGRQHRKFHKKKKKKDAYKQAQIHRCPMEITGALLMSTSFETDLLGTGNDLSGLKGDRRGVSLRRQIAS